MQPSSPTIHSPNQEEEQNNSLLHQEPHPSNQQDPQTQFNPDPISPGEVVVALNIQDNTTNQSGNDKTYARPPKKELSKEQKWPLIFWGTSDRLGLITTILASGSVLALLIIIITLMGYHFGQKDVDLASTAGALNYMSLNLNADPIIRLSLSINNKCPQDTEKLYLGIWPGTSKGCNCPGLGIKAESCAEKQKSVCSDISSIDSANMFIWEHSKLCVRRAKLNVEYVKTVNCPTGFKSCCQDADPKKCLVGICMKDNVDCPLTAISIETTGDEKDRLAQDKYLAFSRNSEGNPVIDITISNNDVPCFSMNQTAQGKGDYVLLNTHPGCSMYGKDELFSTKIDSTSQTNVIKFNELSQDILKLPGYQKVTDSTTSYLSARKRITVANNDECLGLDTKIMDNASTAALNLNKYVSGTAIAAIAAHCLLVILLCASFAFAVRQVGWIQALHGKASGLWLFVYVVIMFVELSIYVVMAVLVHSARNMLVETQGYLGHLNELGCFPIGAPSEVIADCHSVADVVSSKLNEFAVTLLTVTLVTYVPIVSIIIYKNNFKR